MIERAFSDYDDNAGEKVDSRCKSSTKLRYRLWCFLNNPSFSVASKVIANIFIKNMMVIYLIA